jgi:hypothetical protein
MFPKARSAHAGQSLYKISIHHRHESGKDAVLCSASVLHTPHKRRDTQHPTWSIKRGVAFQWGSGGWEAEACIPPGVLLR